MILTRNDIELCVIFCCRPKYISGGVPAQFAKLLQYMLENLSNSKL